MRKAVSGKFTEIDNFIFKKKEINHLVIAINCKQFLLSALSKPWLMFAYLRGSIFFGKDISNGCLGQWSCRSELLPTPEKCAVWIQSSAIVFTINCIEKTKIKKREAGHMAPPKKSNGGFVNFIAVIRYRFFRCK